MKFYIAGALVLVGATAMGQDLLNANRPGLTNASTLQGPGVLTIESGFTRLQANGLHTLSGFEPNIRYGLRNNMELQFAPPGYSVEARGKDLIGWSDAGISAYKYFGHSGTDMTASFGLTLPTGNATMTQGAINPNIGFNANRALNSTYAVGYSFLGQLNHSGSVYTPSAGHVVELDRNLPGNTTALADLTLNTAPGANPTGTWQLAYIYKHTANKQLDMRLGRQFMGAGTFWYIGFGYSFKPR